MSAQPVQWENAAMRAYRFTNPPSSAHEDPEADLARIDDFVL